MVQVGAPEGFDRAQAFGIDDQGRIVGLLERFSASLARAYVWTEATGFVDLDADQDGNRDVELRFETQRLVDEGNLSPGAQELTIWGRDPVTNQRFCGSTNVTVVP